MKAISLLLIALCFASVAVEACHRRVRGNVTPTVNFAARNPIMIAPTPSPTPPPPPPPIPPGWQPPGLRPEAQTMTRINCDARIQFVIPQMDGVNSLSRVNIDEAWVYTCVFNVYVQIDLSPTPEPQYCACGAWFARLHPKDTDGTFPKNITTTINDFRLVAFDNRLKAPGPEFSRNLWAQFIENSNTTDTLAGLVRTSEMEYSSITKGWSGKLPQITNDVYPSVMQPSNPNYSPFYVTAMCFGVTQTYISKFKWPEPPYPLLHTAPNVWMTDCIQWTTYVPQSVVTARFPAKRDAEAVTQATDNLWPKFFRDFLLFPLPTGNSAVSGGVLSQRFPRWISAFYNESNCIAIAGMVSFDRYFTYELARDRTTYGSFLWTRTYVKTLVVAGVPTRFSSSDFFANNGYTKVTWAQTLGVRDSQYRVGVLHAFLKGVPHANPNLNPNLGPQSRMCVNVPNVLATCNPGTAGCVNETSEGVFAFEMPSGQIDAGSMAAMTPQNGLFSCFPYLLQCPSEVTRLSFQNFGALARDYAKRRDSLLLTGPRYDYCKVGTPTEQVFDPIVFEPFTDAKSILKKRGERAQLSNLAKVQANLPLVAGRNGEAVFSGVARPLDVPGAGDMLVRAGGGSADQFGRPDGDHPVTFFPEVYTAPITVNPEDTSYDGVTAAQFESSAAVCLEGSLGCSCRTMTSRVRCDAPLECRNEFCARPVCPPGQPGCSCASGDSCTGAGYSCSAEKICVFTSTCAAGGIGCPCNRGGVCSDAGTKCASCDDDSLPDDVRLNMTKQTGDPLNALTPTQRSNLNCGSVCAKLTCSDEDLGKPGCPCKNGTTCDRATDVCDKGTRLCQAPLCNPGAPGCVCSNGDRCAANFACSNGFCVQKTCPQGSAGCPCTPTEGCQDNGYNCRALDISQSQFQCVAVSRVCGDNTKKCAKFCGDNNVLLCPSCSNQKILCRNPTGVSAASTVAPITALIMFIAMLLFM